MKTNPVLLPALVAALALCPLVRADDISSLFAPSSNAAGWTVSVHHTGIDTGNNASNFLTGSGDFQAAVSVIGRGDYIASNTTGSTGGYPGDYTQFVFRQTFDLTGYDAANATLSFQWAADDTGEGFAERGSWLNRFTVNGSGFQGIDSDGYYNYDAGKIVLLTGFTSGVNTIDFYVQGNGITDGFELKVLSFTGTSTGAPDSASTIGLLGSALIALACVRRRWVR